MNRDYDDTREQRKRDVEPPAHKKRRQTRQALDYYQTIDDLDELEQMYEEDEVETFEPMKRR